MQEKIKDFIGYWLTVCFEHKWLYFLFTLLLTLLFLFCRYMAWNYYSTQLSVIVPSKYQFLTLSCDFFSILLFVMGIYVEDLRKEYVR